MAPTYRQRRRKVVALAAIIVIITAYEQLEKGKIIINLERVGQGHGYCKGENMELTMLY